MALPSLQNEHCLDAHQVAADVQLASPCPHQSENMASCAPRARALYTVRSISVEVSLTCLAVIQGTKPRLFPLVCKLQIDDGYCTIGRHILAG